MNKKLSYDYNKELLPYAREQRKLKHFYEVLLWNVFRNRRFNNVKINRQKTIGNYIVDFVCHECSLVIEIDGEVHNFRKEYDAKRDNYLQSLGLSVIRISTKDLDRDFEGEIRRLRENPVFDKTKPPTNPLLEGGGTDVYPPRREGNE